MKLSEMLKYTRFLLQEKEPGTWEDEELIAFINQGNKRVADVAKIHRNITTVLVSAKTYTIDPVVFATINQIAFLTLDVGVGTAMDKIPYRLFENKLYFYDELNGTLTINYYALPAELVITNQDATSDVDPTFHEIACLFAAMRAKQNDEEFLQAREFKKEFDESMLNAARNYRGTKTRFIYKFENTTF